jgi:hypothetical protein
MPAMQTEAHNTNESPPRRSRNEYYRGDADCPAQYHVFRCTHSHTHHAPKGMYDRRKGCLKHYVNYTAKHWGHRGTAWQSTCPQCGRKPQRNKGMILATYDTREEAQRMAQFLDDQVNAEKLDRQMWAMIEAGRDYKVYAPFGALWSEVQVMARRNKSLTDEEMMRQLDGMWKHIDSYVEELRAKYEVVVQ